MDSVFDYEAFVSKATQNEIKVAVAADILSLAKLKAPGEFGASVVVGTTQRFGIPLGYGGPHMPHIFATKEAYKRSIPGRIIGVTKDKNGKRALRMALQTREQHIKREKATSNICTAQVLLAVMAGMYAVYHGKERDSIHCRQCSSANKNSCQNLIENLGFKQLNSIYFDTLLIEADAKHTKAHCRSKWDQFQLYRQSSTFQFQSTKRWVQKEVKAIVRCFEKAIQSEINRSRQQ